MFRFVVSSCSNQNSSLCVSSLSQSLVAEFQADKDTPESNAVEQLNSSFHNLFIFVTFSSPKIILVDLKLETFRVS